MASRFPQLLAMMAQSGIDAAATPNIAGGGMTDIFRGMSNAGKMAQDRDLATFDLSSRKQRQIQDQLDYLRQMKQLEETQRHNLELEQEARTTADRLRAVNETDIKIKNEAEKRASTNDKNKLYTDLANQPDYSSVDPTDHLDFRFGAGMPGQGRLLQIASQPPSGTVDAVQSGMLSPEDEAIRSGQFDLQFPMASPMEAAGKLDTSSPESDPGPQSSMSDLPFASPLSVASNRRVDFKPTLVPRAGHEIVRGAELHGADGGVIAGMQKRTDEQKVADTLAGKVTPTQIVKVSKPDGPHSVLIDRNTGDEIADLGAAQGNESSTQTERFVDEWLSGNGLERNPANILKAIKARAVASNVGGVYPIIKGNDVVYADRAGAIGQSAPRTLYDAAGNPSVAGQEGRSTSAPPMPSGTAQQRLSGFKIALDQAKDISALLDPKNNPNALFGPLAGRVTLAEVSKLGGMGASPQQVELATRLQRFLSSQAFADGGKQLTPTELEQFRAVSPALTDTIEQAVLKTRLALEFIQKRGQADIDVMPPRERAQFSPEIVSAFGRDTTPATAPTGGATNPKDMSDEQLRLMIQQLKGGK